MKVDESLASASAAKVLAAHAAGKTHRDEEIMPPVSAAPTKNSRQQALQRHAIQKGEIFNIPKPVKLINKIMGFELLILCWDI